MSEIITFCILYTILSIVSRLIRTELNPELMVWWEKLLYTLFTSSNTIDTYDHKRRR